MKPTKSQTKTLVRSSAAEYLTFVAQTGDVENSVEMRYQDENIWLTQKMIAELYGVTVSAINQHLKELTEDGEFDRSTIKQYLIVQTEGKRQVKREIDHYNLQTIISLGFKIENQRAVQFRKWAREIVKNYTIQGWDMNVERFKQAFQFDKEFFERQLERIREIRLSERMFYQKITDLFATAIDYDKTAQSTLRFYATIQNKFHYAVHKHTAAEVIHARANADKKHMGLTSWQDSPDGKIKKSDVVIAKNYLTADELGSLERLVNGYLEFAEDMTLRHIPLTMEDWENRFDRLLSATDREILDNPGKISAETAKHHAETQFEKYRVVQDGLFESDYDLFVKLEEKARASQ